MNKKLSWYVWEGCDAGNTRQNVHQLEKEVVHSILRVKGSGNAIDESSGTVAKCQAIPKICICPPDHICFGIRPTGRVNEPDTNSGWENGNESRKISFDLLVDGSPTVIFR